MYMDMKDILTIRRGLSKRFENEGELKKDFINFLKENNEEYLTELQTEKIMDGDIQPDGSIDFDILKVEKYEVNFNYGRYADTLEKEVYEHIVSVDEEPITEQSVEKHVNSSDLLDLLTGKLGIIEVDVVFNMLMTEYIEFKPDVNYIEELISEKMDVESDLESYIKENKEIRADFLLNEIIERGYSAWINAEDLKPEISITFEAENYDLAQHIMESEELERFEKASDFFKGVNAVNYLYRNCLYSESDFFTVQVFFEIDPDDYEKEIVSDIESVVILLQDIPVNEYLSEYMKEEMYHEVVFNDMKEKGYPENVKPEQVGAVINVSFVGSTEQLAERLMEIPDFSLSTISSLHSSERELLYKNKDLFSIEIAYDIEPTEVFEEL